MKSPYELTRSWWPERKWARQAFHRGVLQTPRQYIKICSTGRVTVERQREITVRCYFTASWFRTHPLVCFHPPVPKVSSFSTKCWLVAPLSMSCSVTCCLSPEYSILPFSFFWLLFHSIKDCSSISYKSKTILLSISHLFFKIYLPKFTDSLITPLPCRA